MKIKNFFFAGIAGEITDFLLGWLFYGILFKEYFPNEVQNIMFVFLGCMTFGLFVSYLFVKWAAISRWVTGLKSGAIIGLFIGLMNNFFMRSSSIVVDYLNFGIDLAIGIIMTAIVGAVIAIINGNLSKD